MAVLPSWAIHKVWMEMLPEKLTKALIIGFANSTAKAACCGTKPMVALTTIEEMTLYKLKMVVLPYWAFHKVTMVIPQKILGFKTIGLLNWMHRVICFGKNLLGIRVAIMA